MKNNPERERELRSRHGIPEDAKQILCFGETSHWDPNWLYTTEEYFNQHIIQILDEAIEELTREPRRIYSLECVFFLRMYWNHRPDRREILKELINSGRLRLTGSGMTTPDTTLPETEAIFRDYLEGQVWLEKNGMTQRPRLAYFPDGFGHSPGVASILAAAGFEYSAVTRIDGMNFPATDYRRAWYYPRPGSNAWLLLKELKTLDFFWRSPDRSRVLTHWNSYTYFQGDNVVYVGPVKWMGKLYGIHQRSEAHVARRVAKFVRQLAPLSRTPYLFCPIGMDFNRPIPKLYELLERYNRSYYEKTGVYTVLLGLDDYLDLVSCHAEKIPVLSLDFNPYWMGFYSSRPGLKQEIKGLTLDLIKTEKLALLTGIDKTSELSSAWDHVILSNHHDFITGTSPDRVYEKEQKLMIQEGQKTLDAALESVKEGCQPPPSREAFSAPALLCEGGRVCIDTPFYTVEMDERQGGCITRWLEKKTGREMLTGLGNDLMLYEDTGGLWRLGHEFAGGKFSVVDRSSQHPASMETIARDSLQEVIIQSEMEGKTFIRHLWFREDSPAVRMSVSGSLPSRRTLAIRFATVLSPRSLIMDVPGAVVDRPDQKMFTPTFWPAKNFAHIKEQESDRGLAVAFFSPATVSADVTGVVEWIAMRNAPKETAFGILPVLAHPASGNEPGEQGLNYGVWFTSSGDWRVNKVPRQANEILRTTWIHPDEADLDLLADFLVEIDNPYAIVGAVKKADSGTGIIARIYAYGCPEEETRLTYRGKPIQTAWLCDAREKNLKALDIQDGAVVVPLGASIRTIRLHV